MVGEPQGETDKEYSPVFIISAGHEEVNMATNWAKIDVYCMKCRLYPNKAQEAQIEALFHGAHVCYNMVLYRIGKEKQFTREKPNKEGDGTVHFPDFNAAFSKASLDILRHENEFVNYLPGEAMSSIKYGLSSDMKKSWSKSGSLPVEYWSKKKGPRYYSKKRPRTSFCYQTAMSNVHVDENRSVVRVKIGSRNYQVDGLVKARGVNQRVRFTSDLTKDFHDWVESGEVKKVPMRIEKENGRYYVVFMLKNVWKPYTVAENRSEHTGIDVGEISLATLSDGTKYQNIFETNPYFYHNTASLDELNKIMSRKWGWKNIKFREAHKKDTEIVPSKAYTEADQRYKVLSARRNDRKRTYYDMVIADIIAHNKALAIETLSVKDMFWYKEPSDEEEKKKDEQTTGNTQQEPGRCVNVDVSANA